MELEGFGASLLGRAIYVCANHDSAWIPLEFISGTPYSCKLLITGESPGHRCIEAEHTWTAVFKPNQPKDWSVIATVLRGLGPNILLVFDTHAPVAPPTFISYLDGIVLENRTTVTRIWIGEHIEIPVIPDAIFFPIVYDAKHAHDIFAMLKRLPGRGSHGPWFSIPEAEWPSIVKATQDSGLGMVVSDIGESSWSLFWHKLSDSRSENHAHMTKRGLTWLKTGLAILEKNNDA